MTRLRVVIIALLLIAPLGFLIGAGFYHLWSSGWIFTAWWPMALSITLGYALLWYWTRRRSKLLPATAPEEPPGHWTERDQRAWGIVEARVNASATPTVEQLSDPRRYSEEAISLALEIARVYQPGATDPFNHLTLPEILACAELVAEDLARKVNTYVIGSHLLTVGHWRSMRRYADWGQSAWELSWLARVALEPIKAGAQYLASKAGGTILTQVQNNVLAWFHAAYLHELGRYLIELNSGRLRVGAKRYRELLAQDPTANGPAPSPLSVAVVGQVKAGKSSLINALLGERRAEVDVVPVSAAVTRFELKSGDLPPLSLIDTPGYGASGPTDREVQSVFAAAKDADIVILVTPARTAARAADVEFLNRLRVAFAQTPQLKPPPIFIALSQVDLLTPAAEWSPPYDWQTGTRPKEASIREAIAAAQEQLSVQPVIPVVSLPERLFNRDGLIAAIAERIGDARGAALLRLLDREQSARPIARMLEQLVSASQGGLRAIWSAAKARL